MGQQGLGEMNDNGERFADLCATSDQGKSGKSGHLTGCGGADPHNSSTSASSASLGHFST